MYRSKMLSFTDMMMRKRIGIICWWLGTWAALLAFAMSFYWLLSSAHDAVQLALLSLGFIPAVTGPLWALSYFLAGAFWNESE